MKIKIQNKYNMLFKIMKKNNVMYLIKIYFAIKNTLQYNKLEN